MSSTHSRRVSIGKLIAMDDPQRSAIARLPSRDRRAFLAIALSTSLSLPAAAADTFPNKPVRIVIGVAVGALTDTMTRMIAAELQQRWGQPVVVESKPGASGSIAAAMVARTPADGHTLAVVISTYATNPSLQKDLGYDARNALVPVTMIAKAPTVLLTGANSGIRDFRDLAAKAKADPTKYAFGSAGSGGMTHLVGEYLNSVAGLKLLHVPYKGGAPALNDLMGGQIPLQFSTIPTIYQQYKAGKVRALAVAASQRNASIPEVPTFKELGYPEMVVEEWYALLAPAGTPEPVLQKISKDVSSILTIPAIRENLAGLDVGGASPTQTRGFIEAEMTRWDKFIKAHNITGE